MRDAEVLTSLKEYPMQKLDQPPLLQRAVLILSFLALSATSVVWAQPAAQPGVDTLLERARQNGSVRVVVELDMSYAPETTLPDAAAIEAQRRTLEQLQDRVLHELRGMDVRGVRKLRYTPFMGLTVGGPALRALDKLPAVRSIREDAESFPVLQDTVPLIGANGTGFRGAGYAVAVLDTGVDYGHGFVWGRLNSEACYSTNSSTHSSLCPGGVMSSTAPGSGLDCTGVPGCDHGTHVAGIAIGTCGFSNCCEGWGGVAISSSLISIQVFSRRDTASFFCPSPPCLGSFDTDQCAGLERVKDLVLAGTDVAAVNMSIGGAVHSNPCINDLRRPIIQELTNLGVAVVIASGNNSSSSGVTAPSCIPEAVTVGATMKTDAVASFSNSDDQLDLWAPGDGFTSLSGIESSVPNACFAFMPGTSMAAPHVAGAFAQLREKAPLASVNDLLNALKNQGVPVTDSRNGVTRSRIQVDAALNALP